jgi:aspartate/methionine/tyrosine aminotransferase
MKHLGTETAFNVLDRAEQLSKRGRDIINLGIGQPDFKTSPHIVEAGVKALRDGHHGYTPAPGISSLRETIAEDIFRYRRVSVDPGRIVVVPGGKVTMFFTMLMFGEKGREILYPNPGFPIYESMIDFTGATGIPIKLIEDDGVSVDIDSILEGITERTALLILNSPANPTGSVIPKDQIDRLVKSLVDDFPWVAILSDEIYSRITYDSSAHTSLLSYPELEDRVILLDGWSKTYAMTGWRIGYSVWPEALIDDAIRLAINCHSCVNAACQFAGIAALDGPQDSVLDMVCEFDLRRKFIINGLNELPGIGCFSPHGAFYAFPNIAKIGLSSKMFQDRLLEEEGVAIIAGTSFGSKGEGYLRFSYASSMEKIEIALDRTLNFIEKLYND